MKNKIDEFDNITEAVQNFQKVVDELEAQYVQECRERDAHGVPSDWDFSIEAEWYSGQVDQAAREMREGVETQLTALAGRLHTWQNKAPKDGGLLAYLWAIPAAGLTLTIEEAKALETRAAGNYLALKVLEPMSGGFVSAPDVYRLEHDLGVIRSMLSRVEKYRGRDCALAEVAGFGHTGSAATHAARAKDSLADAFKSIDSIKTRWLHI